MRMTNWKMQNTNCMIASTNWMVLKVRRSPIGYSRVLNNEGRILKKSYGRINLRRLDAFLEGS